MPIALHCPDCGKHFHVADSLAGKSAKCPCGARLSIPLTSSVVEPPPRSPMPATSASVLSFYDERLTADAAASRESPEERAQRNLENLNPFKVKAHGLAERLLAPGSPRLLQLLAATIVGAGLGYSSAVKLREPTTRMTIYATIGGAILGAIVGLLLLTSDALRTRKSTGRRVPWLLNLYLARGWVSILLWIITAFAGAFLFAAYLAMTTP